MKLLTEIITDWQHRGFITSEQQVSFETTENTRPVSIYTLLRTLLYAGILLFTSGAGLLIYKHIDTIGHDALIVALALLTVGCFYYTYRQSPPFSKDLVETETKFTDFVLLMGALLFLSLEGYVQWRYNLFGTRYGLATVIPAIIFIFCAYRFDHRGVLSMGLTALASWVGLTVTPFEVLSGNDFQSDTIIHTAVVFGVVVISIGLWLEFQSIKKHFTFTYLFLAGNLLFISSLAGLFTTDYWFLYAFLIFSCAWFFFRYAQRSQSFLFLLMAVAYSYIAFTFLLFKWIDDGAFWFTLGSLYFVLSAGAVVLFILNYKKLLTPQSNHNKA
jgi:hypothetical protein